MPDIYHEIGNIIFQTKSEKEIRYFQNDFFKEFQTKESNYDVRHRMTLVECNTHFISPLNSKEKETLTKCSLGDNIGLSTLIIPPIIYDRVKLENCKLHENDLTGFDNLLLQSNSVRQRLKSCFDIQEHVKIQLHSFSVTFYDSSNSTIDIYYSPVCEEVFEDDVMANGIRRMFTNFLPSFSAAMIHSSALLMNGKVGIFLAPDEGGKTTAAKLGEEYSILCDDQNIIKKGKDEFIAYSTPWGYNLNAHLEGPVKGFFLLVKGDNFNLEKLKPRDLFSYLWNEHLDYSVKLPKNIRLKFFDVLYAMSNSIPGYQLTFQKDYIDWGAIEKVME